MESKRIISAILICSFMLSALGVFSASSASDVTDMILMDSASNGDIIEVYSDKMNVGDVTGDGKINMLDSFELRKYVLGYETNALRFTMDTDDNGKKNTVDIFNIKLIVKGLKNAVQLNNTTVEKAFDENETALKLSVTDAGESDALFDINASSIDLSKYKYVTIVWKGNSKAEIGFVDRNHNTEYSANVENVVNNGYGYAIAEIADNCNRIEVKYAGEGAFDELFVDSVIFASTAEDAKAAAEERLALRNAPPVDYNYVAINFDNADSLSLLSPSSASAMTYDAANEAVRFIALMPGTEYYANLDLKDFGISADEYKYVVYTSMAPSGRTDVTAFPAGEIYFCAGEVEEVTTGYSTMFSNVSDGMFHSSVIELTNADFWKGDVHSLRLDYFTETTSFGFIHYLKSVIFCDSYEAAQALCVDKNKATTDVRKLFNYGLYTEGEMRLPYRIYVPSGYSSDKQYPVLTFLHGAGQRGEDGLMQIEAVVPHFFDDPASDAAYDSIVIVPQCSIKYRWVETPWNLGFYYVDELPASKPMEAYVKVLEDVSNRYSVDKDRFYVTGISMGGYGTWDMLMRYGDMFAAGMPLCGGGDKNKAEYLAQIPIRTFHGSEDADVPVTATRRMYNAIIAAGGEKIEYTEYEGYPHNVWDVTYSNPENLDWLFSHKLSDREE